MRVPFLACCLALPGTGLAAEDPVAIARYAYLMPGSSHAQRHPLQVTLTQVRFPQEIATVGEAMNHLLTRSGYRLDEQRSHWANTILMPQPLPEIHRDLGPIHLSEALAVLAGSAWRLKVNPLYRTLIIRPTEEWQAQLERQAPPLEIEDAQSLGMEDPGSDVATADLPLPTSLHDAAEIFVEDMTLQEALDLIVPVGWKLRPEVPPALLRTRISLISSTTWWDALTELTRKLGNQTQDELVLHVFEDQKLVVLGQP